MVEKEKEAVNPLQASPNAFIRTLRSVADENVHATSVLKRRPLFCPAVPHECTLHTSKQASQNQITMSLVNSGEFH